MKAHETVELLTKETPDFIPPNLWLPNSLDLNLVDYKIIRNNARKGLHTHARMHTHTHTHTQKQTMKNNVNLYNIKSWEPADVVSIAMTAP